MSYHSPLPASPLPCSASSFLDDINSDYKQPRSVKMIKYYKQRCQSGMWRKLYRNSSLITWSESACPMPTPDQIRQPLHGWIKVLLRSDAERGSKILARFACCHHYIYFTGCFFWLVRPKNCHCQTLRKFWNLELCWWDLLCNLTLSQFLGRTSKKNTLYIIIYWHGLPCSGWKARPGINIIFAASPRSMIMSQVEVKPGTWTNSLFFRISWPVALDQKPSWKLIWTVPPSTKETCRPEVRYIRQGRPDACQLLEPSCHAASCRSLPPRPRGSGTRPGPTGREDWRWPPGHHLMAWGLCGGVARLLLNRHASGSWFGRGEEAPEKGRRRAERTLACEEQCAGSTPWDLSRVWSSIELRSRQYLWQNQGVYQNSRSWKMSQICTRRIK